MSASSSVSAAATRAATPPAAGRRSPLARSLQRLSRRGLRLVITAPTDVKTFERDLQRFPERKVDTSAHVQWDTDYRVFCSRSRKPHDRGSWRILAVDARDRVVGAITARCFGPEIQHDYLHILTLLDQAGPVFREHCELAISEVGNAAARAGRAPAEVSNWAVEPGPAAALVAVALTRAMAALLAAFDAPLVVLAADHRRGEVARLMRYGAAPLGRAGRFALPPFVHHASGAWLRLLLVDTPIYQARTRSQVPEDLALLRASVPVISAG